MSSTVKTLQFKARILLLPAHRNKQLSLFGDEVLGWTLGATATGIATSLKVREVADRSAPVQLGTLVAGEDAKSFAMLNTLIRSHCPMQLIAMERTVKRHNDDLEPVHVSVNLSTGALQTAIVGARFRGPVASKAVMNLKTSDAFSLTREPTNKFDPNAVLVSTGNLALGYVPKTESATVSYLMDVAGITPVVELIQAGGSPRIRLVWS